MYLETRMRSGITRDKFQAPSGKNDSFHHERKSAQLQHILQVDEVSKFSTRLLCRFIAFILSSNGRSRGLGW